MTENKFWKRYGTFVLYTIFGFLATVLDAFLYWLCYRKIRIPNVPSATISAVLTLIFCFFTNKTMVYKSRDWSFRNVVKEMVEFFSLRILTILFNVGFMYVTVSLADWPAVPMKWTASIIVGIMNYLIGKLIVFKTKSPSSRKSPRQRPGRLNEL